MPLQGTLSQWTITLSSPRGQHNLQSVLLVSPRCRVYEWAPEPGDGSPGAHPPTQQLTPQSGSKAVLLSDDPDNVAAAPVSAAHTQAGRASGLPISGAQPVWLLLSATYGVLELGSAIDRLHASSAAEADSALQGTQASARTSGPLTVEQKQQVSG
jgi:hypothetical protein